MAPTPPGYRLGLYVQDEWHLSETLVSTLGLREDRNDRTGTKASPRVALVWRPASYTTIKALYGRAHRAPAADDVAVARAAGLDVAIVEGCDDNIKLTFPADFARAETILKDRA